MPEATEFMIEGARLIYRNFAGKEQKPFNDKGDRNFCCVLDPKTAADLEKMGYNVKTTKPRDMGEDEEAEPGIPFVQIKVKFQNRPPKIVVLTDTSRTLLNSDSVEILDYADIRNVDLIAVPFFWEMGGKNGYSAYLKTMFVTIEEDALEAKYAIVEG